MADDWYRHYPADFIDGVIGMTLEETGAYILLLNYMYLTRRPLKDDDAHICGILQSCDIRVWRRLKRSLLAKGKLAPTCDGHLTNLRATSELASRNLERTSKVAAGHLGGISSGQSRKNKDLGEAPASSKTKHIREDKKRGEDIEACFAGVLDPEHAKAVIAHRQQIKSALTPYSAKLLAKKFAQVASPNDAADLMIERGWRGFDPTWQAAQKSNGGPAKSGGGWRSPVEYDDQGIPIVLDAFGRPFDEVQ